MSVLGPILGPVLGPVALSLTRAGVPMWSPRVLFAAGEQGAWYDPSDLSTLFQDAAGTTPVTAVGQPVGLLKDKSGRGNHASQSTATARPTLQQDSGGRYYLSFDGVDDALVTAKADFSATGKIGFFAAVRKTSDSYTGVLFEQSASDGGNDGSFRITAPQGSAPAYGFALRGAGQAAGADALIQATGYAAPRTDVISCALDLAQMTSAQQILPRVDGAVPATAAAGLTYAGSGTFGNYPLYIGSRAGTSLPFTGRLYGLIVRGAASTAGQIASAERYLAGKSGVTL